MRFAVTLYRHRMPKEGIEIEADLVSASGKHIIFYTKDQTKAMHGLAFRSGDGEVYVCQEILLGEHDTYSVRRERD